MADKNKPEESSQSSDILVEPPLRPDLFFGLVGAVGSDIAGVIDQLEGQLSRVGYESVRIKISSLLRRLPGNEHLSKDAVDSKFQYYDNHMRAGTKVCEDHKRGEALAILSIPEIVKRREELRAQDTKERVKLGLAFIIDSIKRPAEVEFYRRLYGDFFTLIGVFGSREARVTDLQRKIATSGRGERGESPRVQAEKLIEIDELETGVRHGQNVSDTFWRADFFIRGDRKTNIQTEIQRLVQLLFDSPEASPRRDEISMYLAKAVSMRSADLSRQVGALIVNQESEPIASGCNEVPKFGGGQYWGDASANRDIELGHDSNAKFKRELVQELFDRLKNAGWLSPHLNDKPLDTLVESAIGNSNSPLKGTRADSLIEFGRMVHAEMAALTQLSRLGQSGKDATLYCTTFPCHMCARHIIAAGIKKVVYIEPYQKSLAADLYPDSIAVNPDGEAPGKVNFVPFEGVAPRRFLQFFEKSRRKDSGGTASKWNEATAKPLVNRGMMISTHQIAENFVLKEIKNWLREPDKI